MIPELAHFALILALAISIITALLPFIAPKKQHYQALHRLVIGQGLFVFMTFGLLVTSFLQNDFSVIYVADNSSRALPIFYKLAAVWGAHEGSMLLWVVILSLLMNLLLIDENLSHQAIISAQSILSIINVGFILFILTTSNPFLRDFHHLQQQGADLNPLLQDIGFLMHPPILYMGYVGFGVVFAIAMAAIVNDEPLHGVLTSMRRWTLLAWSFLTLGITLGSWWAYRELGWGGFWFWDPVENASIMPWFSGTALLHALKLTDKEPKFSQWPLLLGLITFFLSLLGTFLVRSGILTSVHAFALSPTRGVYMLIFLLLVCISALSVYAYRFKPMSNKSRWSFFSKPAQLLLNTGLLMVMMATVLLGTLYPLIIDALSLGQLSVGSPYFDAMAMVLMTPVLILMAVVPVLHWGQRPVGDFIKRIVPCLFLAVIAGFTLPLYLLGVFKPAASLGLSIGIWILLQTFISLLKTYRKNRQVSISLIAMTLAHIGLATLIIGVVSCRQFGLEKDLRVSLHEVIHLNDYTLVLDKLYDSKGANYRAVQARFSLFKKRERLSVISTEKRYFPSREVELSHVGIDASLFRDIYVALGEPLPGGAWSMRLYYKPLVRFIWLGGLLIVVGGLLPIISRRRQRIKRLSYSRRHA